MIKVIDISDGETITVLQNKARYKTHLNGIETPEKAQGFGNRAKQFTTGMSYGKHVKVVQKDVSPLWTYCRDGLCL